MNYTQYLQMTHNEKAEYHKEQERKKQREKRKAKERNTGHKH